MVFSGFYLNYRSSKKAGPADAAPKKAAASHVVGYRTAGLLLLVVAYGYTVNFTGPVSGSFIYLTLLMLTGSLIVLLAPLRLIRPWGILAFFLVFITLETLLY